MATSAAVAEQFGLLGRPKAELALRVAGGQRAGEVLPIAEQKCTLGADEGCRLHFGEPGVRALHCLILRGQAETVVRRFSPDTRLNGCDFTDAPLRPGDRLTLGPLELDVIFPEPSPLADEHGDAEGLLNERRLIDEELPCLDGEQAPARNDRPAHEDRPAAEPSRHAQELVALDARQAQLAADIRTLEQQRAAWEQQCGDRQRQFDEARQAWNEERQAIERQAAERMESLAQEEAALNTAKAELDRQSSHLQQQTDGADHQRQAASAEIEQRAAALDEREQALHADRAKLDRERTVLHAEQTAFHAERDGWEEVQEEARTRLSDKMQQLERRLAELNAERAAWETDRDRSLADFAEQSQTLTRKLASLESDRRTLLSERASWHAEQHQRETQWTGRQRTLAAAEEEQARQKEELARQKNEAELRLQQLAAREAQLHDAEQQRAVVEARLAAEQSALTDQHQALEHQRTAWDAQRNQQTEADRQALTAAETEVARLKTELAAQQGQNQQLQQAQIEAEQRRQSAEEKLTRQQAALEAARLALEQERAAWQSKQSEPVSPPPDSAAAHLVEEELARLQQELDTQRAAVAETHRQQAEAAEDLARRQNELEVARRSLDDERARWQAEQIERSQATEAEQIVVDQQTVADRERLAALEAELASLRRAWDDERRDWQAEAQRRATLPVATPADDASELQDQLLELTTELEHARRALDDDRRHWEAERLRQQAELAEHATQLRELRQHTATAHEPASEQDGDSSPPPSQPLDPHVEAVDLLNQFASPQFAGPQCASHETAEVSFAEPVETAPVNMTELLNRFGISIDNTPDEHGAAKPPSGPRSDADRTAAEDAAASGTAASEAIDRAARPSPPAEEDEDSIDAYMARLMQRLGSKAPAPAPRHAEPLPSAAPAAPDQPEPEAEPVALVVTKLSDPSEMGRRALPPERASDLSAMRELANLNARSAIDKHQRRTMRDTGLNKAAVTFVGLVAAVVEGTLWLQGSPTAFYLMLGGGVVALFWGWQYAANRQQFAPTGETAPHTPERRVADRRAAEPLPATAEVTDEVAPVLNDELAGNS